ncbi:Gluconate transport-inducing protein [Entomophthora muscae]|uniref:Gluconate transport-inducing protein n=1 Tax=Entomophthora muscae TaxID=34485 RepID=A0ACC2UKR7_9FUNG|nr:Gluconate transport-inducing protein [Entomophthora muscae]
MESYVGYVQTVSDALRLFEAVRMGMLPTTNRRLSGTERRSIHSGSVYIFDETSSGVQRWTDGLRWSASRLNGHFLIYHQKVSARGLEPCLPLIKRTLSVVTADKRKLVLISYYSDKDVDANLLTFPSLDPRLRSIVIPQDYYFRRITQMISPSLESSFMLTPLTGRESNFPRIRLPTQTSPPPAYGPDAHTWTQFLAAPSHHPFLPSPTSTPRVPPRNPRHHKPPPKLTLPLCITTSSNPTTLKIAANSTHFLFTSN